MGETQREDRFSERVPRHIQVADALRAEIEHGRLVVRECLPPQSELAEQFNTSRTTIRLALSALASQGFIGSEQRQGVPVRRGSPIRILASDQDNRTRRSETTSATFNAEVARQGRIGRQDILEVGPKQATLEIATWLDIEEGSQVIARRRVMLVDEESYQLGDSYYIYETVRGTAIANSAPVQGGVLSILERAHGKPIDHYVDELSFRMPTADEAALLQIDPGVSVVRVVRIAYDAQGAPMEAFDQLLAGDKHILLYQVSAT